MADQRTQNHENQSDPRAERDTREAAQRPSDAWVPASILPTPKPREGMTFRWVRTSMFDRADNKNVSQKFREGWVPCKAEDHKELQVRSDIGSQFEGNIEVGGLLLCMAPTELVEKRREYYDKMAQGQMTAVDEGFMRDNDPRMPLLNPERKSRTSFGGS